MSIYTHLPINLLDRKSVHINTRTQLTLQNTRRIVEQQHTIAGYRTYVHISTSKFCWYCSDPSYQHQIRAIPPPYMIEKQETYPGIIITSHICSARFHSECDSFILSNHTSSQATCKCKSEINIHVYTKWLLLFTYALCASVLLSESIILAVKSNTYVHRRVLFRSENCTYHQSQMWRF